MKVIFACVHNAGRSQMAAALYNSLTKSSDAVSAGTQPAERVHPEVVTVMKEVGIDLTNSKPQRLTDDLAKQAEMLITMGCGEACPYVPGLKREDWPLTDPKGRPLDEVRKIRDEVKHKIEELLRTQAVAEATLVVETAAFNDHDAVEQLLIENELPVPGSADRPVRFLAGRRNHELIACLGWESYEERVLLRSLAVRQSEQRRGIGSILVQAALSRLKAEGVREFYLLTSTASEFADRFGFKVIDRCLLPEELKASQQMKSGACAAAQCMRLQL